MLRLSCLVLLLFLSFAQETWACSCHPLPASVEEAYKKANLVVLGKIIEIDAPKKGGQYKFIVSVEKSWKGNPEKEVTLSSNIHGFSCGVGKLNEGDEYLFYAWKWPEEKQKIYNIKGCDRHVLKEEAGSDIKILNSIAVEGDHANHK
jgi:hypothetical protein